MATRSPSCLPSAAASGAEAPLCRPSSGLQEGRLSPLSSVPLDLAALSAEVAGPGRGAVVTMTGAVRDSEDGRPIAAITYEAYAPMAERIVRSLVERAESQWGVKAAVRHRVGRIPVGEAAVIVAAAGVHRPEAFEACRFLIDEVKAGAPIWKTSFEEVR